MKFQSVKFKSIQCDRKIIKFNKDGLYETKDESEIKVIKKSLGVKEVKDK